MVRSPIMLCKNIKKNQRAHVKIIKNKNVVQDEIMFVMNNEVDSLCHWNNNEVKFISINYTQFITQNILVLVYSF